MLVKDEGIFYYFPLRLFSEGAYAREVQYIINFIA